MNYRTPTHMAPAPLGYDERCLYAYRSPATGVQWFNQRDPIMEDFHRRGIAPETLGEFCRHVLDFYGLEVPASDAGCFRSALSSVAGVSALMSLSNAYITQGFSTGEDSTLGWVRRVALPNYQNANVSYVDAPARFTLHTKYGSARHMDFGYSDPERWRLLRYSAQFTIDEVDQIDSETSWNLGTGLGVVGDALREVGAAAARLIPDLVWSYILSNPDLADEVPLFHTDRGNIGSGAFDASKVDDALENIGKKFLMNRAEDPFHLNLRGTHVIVPPKLIGPMRRTLRAMDYEASHRIVLRQESRLTDIGTVQPQTENIVEGNNLNWLMAADQSQAPSILLGGLFGRFEPQVRVQPMTQGNWGLNIDMTFDLGVTAVSGAPLYWQPGV